MTKAELVDQVAATAQLPKHQTDAVITRFLQAIMDALHAGECGIAGLWAFPAAPPSGACWTQPTNGDHCPDSRQNSPCIYRGESLPSAGAKRHRNIRRRR